MKRRILFDHVPKTAGTSVVQALAQAVGEPVELKGYERSHHEALARAGNRRLVAGHLWFAPREPLHADWYYATLLRNPIDRFLSQYSFNRSVVAVHGTEDQRRDPQVAAAASHRLEEYLALDIPAVGASYRNYQATHFAQAGSVHPRSLDDDALFDAALASLERYDLVGVFDDLPGFVRAACADLGLDSVALAHLNATPGRERGSRASAEVLDKLASANAVDLRLFAWAQERWRERGSRHRTMAARATSPEARPGLQFGSRDIRIVAVSYEPPLDPRDDGAIRIECDAKVAEPDLTIGIAVYDGRGALVLGTNSKLLGVRVPVSAGPFTARFGLSGALAPGDYSITAALHVGLSHEEGCYHWWSDARRFLVAEAREGREPRDGIAARLTVISR